MVLDYGIYFSKKISILFLHKRILITKEKQVMIHKISCKLSKAHKLIHTQPKKNILSTILKKPLKILNLKDTPKNKLKLYLKYITKNKYNSLPALENKRSRFFGNIENNLERILSFDPWLYVNVCRYFNIKNMLYSDELSVVCVLMGLNGFVENKSAGYFNLNCHKFFCMENEEYLNRIKKSKMFIDDLSSEYDKMCDAIFDDTVGKESEICKISSPFYKEVVLFNNYIEYCKLPTDNNLEKVRVDDEGLSSLCERGIRDYIREKLIE